MKLKSVFLLSLALLPTSGWCFGPLDVLKATWPMARPLSSVFVRHLMMPGVGMRENNIQDDRKFENTENKNCYNLRESTKKLTQHALTGTIEHLIGKSGAERPQCEIYQDVFPHETYTEQYKRWRPINEYPPLENDALLKDCMINYGYGRETYTSILQRIPTLLAVPSMSFSDRFCERKTLYLSLHYGQHRINLGWIPPETLESYRASLPSTATPLEEVFSKNEGSDLVIMRFLILGWRESLNLMPVPFPKSLFGRKGNVLLFANPYDFSAAHLETQIKSFSPMPQRP